MRCLDLALFGALLDFNGHSTLIFGCDPEGQRFGTTLTLSPIWARYFIRPCRFNEELPLSEKDES